LTQTKLYAPSLAKIGAERSKLLSEAKIKALSESKNLPDLIAQLRDSSYQDQISKIQAPVNSRKLERAFNENLIETYMKILKNSPKNATVYLDLYLSKFEVENIKTLIKTTNAKLTSEQKLAKMYLSPEDYLKNRDIIEEAVKASNVSHLVAALKHAGYMLALNMGMKCYEERGSTTCMDVYVDKAFYEKLWESYADLSKREKRHAYFYASIENDSFVLLTLLRGKLLDYDPNWLRLAVPNCYFDIRKETVEAILSAADFEAAFKFVQASRYAEYFVKASTPEETLSNAEKAFKNAVLQYAKSHVVSETFNIGAPLAFMVQKKAEVSNLIALSFGVEVGIKPEEIRSHLLF
jgi:vacuolar-type H+-ATPase subunit C/Vma6